MCTLRNFPNQIEHCIEWGRGKFNDLFVDTPGDLVQFLNNDKVFVGQLKANSTTSGTKTSLEKIEKFISMKKTSNYENCVVMAKEKFNDYYDHTIRDLLSIFPKDHKDKEGQPFWSGPKRAPSPLTFSADDAIHMEFVFSYANLLAANLNIP
jgi:ubiquitin-activating enzyme E1